MRLHHFIARWYGLWRHRICLNSTAPLRAWVIDNDKYVGYKCENCHRLCPIARVKDYNAANDAENRTSIKLDQAANEH